MNGGGFYINWVCEEDFIEVIAIINNCWKKLF